MKHSILVVDDEVDNVDALERLFRKKYKVFKAISGAEGLEILKDQDVALIISDQRMPKMEGVQFLKKSIKTHPETMRILLTGYTDIDSVIGAINSGEVYRYITKPWDPVDLANTVDKAIERFELHHELKQKNTELKEALDELKTLDEAKNHFMVLINHELKTPLTSVLSFLELLSESDLSDDQSIYVDRISKNANKLKKIIEDVLELVSAETGVMKISKKKVAAKKLEDLIGKDLLKLAEERGQSFKFEIDNLSLKADLHLIGKVVHRLVDNAVKFGDKNSEIQIQLHGEDNSAVFQITNKGKGLTETAIKKILKPFALDEDIMHHSAGLGLGLSLCQAILKHHGSHLDIQSSKGSVSISFPLEIA